MMNKFYSLLLISTLLLTGGGPTVQAEEIVFSFSDAQVKSFLAANKVDLVKEWDAVTDQFSAAEEAELTDFAPAAKGHLSAGLTKKLSRAHQRIQAKIEQAIAQSEQTANASDLGSFLAEKLRGASERKQLATQIAAYFAPASVIQRAQHEDQTILDLPSLPISVVEQTTEASASSYQIQSYPTLSQSGQEFAEFEKMRFEYPEDNEEMGQISAWPFMKYLTLFLLTERVITETRAHPPTKEEAPACYYADPENPTAECPDYLQIYTCEGHSFTNLHRNGRDSYNGLYPRGAPIRMEDVPASANKLFQLASCADKNGHCQPLQYPVVQTSSGWIANEVQFYPASHRDVCQSVKYPLTSEQSAHIETFIQEQRQAFDKRDENFNLLEQNCADFSQKVFVQTGYPGHFLDKPNGDKPMLLFSDPNGPYAGIDKSALWAFYRGRGVVGAMGELLYELGSQVIKAGMSPSNPVNATAVPAPGQAEIAPKQPVVAPPIFGDRTGARQYRPNPARQQQMDPQTAPGRP